MSRSNDDGDGFDIDEGATAIVDPNERTDAPPSVSSTSAARTEVSGPIRVLPTPFGRYTLVRRLGVGGMAEVFLATQHGAGGFAKQFVVKKILPHLAENARFVEMFLREAKVAALLNHQNVVQIFELGEEQGTPFIAMEHVDGLTLQTLAVRTWRNGRAVPLEVVLAAIADAALGLHHAHTLQDHEGRPAGLIHRDISPDNLMINKQGITKIVDFGIAKAVDAESVTKTGETKGKVPFMPPELLEGHELDARADLWALGVSMYWMLTGQRPFTGGSDLLTMRAILESEPIAPRILNPSIPLQVEELTLALLTKDRAHRPGSGLEIASAIEPLLPSRIGVVAPFVLQVLALPEAPASDIPRSDAFFASTPLTNKGAGTGSGLRLGGSSSGPVRPAPSRTADATLPEDLAPPRTDATLPLDAPARTGATLASRPGRSRRAPLIGAAAAAFALAVVVFALSGRDDDVPAPSPTAPGATASAATATATAATATATATASAASASTTIPPVAALPVAALPVAALPAAPPAASTAPVAPAAPAAPVAADARGPTRPARPSSTTRRVEARGPAEIAWLTVDGKRLGKGTAALEVPAAASSIVAHDVKRGVRTTMAIAAGAVDYDKLPRGELQVRARPFADVVIGALEAGTTPMAPLPLVVGKYQVTLRCNGKVVTRTVDVKRGEIVRLTHDFEG